MDIPCRGKYQKIHKSEYIFSSVVFKAVLLSQKSNHSLSEFNF